MHEDSDELDPTATDMLLVKLLMGELAVISRLEKHAGFAREPSVTHHTDLD